MTTGLAASRLQNNSLAGIGAGLVAVVAAGFVCSWAGLSQQTTTSVMALAIGVPPAVELQIKGRRRDTNVDMGRIQRGELRRPLGLVVMLLAAAIVLLDEVSGFMMGPVAKLPEVIGGPLLVIFIALVGTCLFLVASYGSQYFAKRPYLWTAVAVGCALAVRELVVFVVGSEASGFKSFVKETVGSLAGMLVAEAVGYLGMLFICILGAWLGRRYHAEFLAKKLARMQAKAAKEGAKQHQSTLQSQPTAAQASPQDPNAPQNSAPKLATLVDRPADLPSAPGGHRIGDPIKQIERLAHLRDTGALTEEEFQVKKTEILCRI